MSRNGSGVYSLPAGNPVVTGTTISSTWANTTLSDIATALTGSVAADGQTAMTGNLQMGNNKITGLAVATASGDALSYGQAATIAALTVTGNATFDTNTLFVDATNNRVGVGTASPATTLDVTGATSALQARFGGIAGRGLEISTATNSGTFEGASVLNARAAGVGNMVFQTDSSERMRIDSSGNVGIGTSSPAYKLDVSATGNILGRFKGTGTISALFLADANTTADTLYIGTVGNNFRVITNSEERMRIDSSGNVGIGTTSTSGYKLAVSDGTTFSVVHAGGGASYYGAITNNPVLFITNNTERARITAAGRFCVNTTVGTGNEVFAVWYNSSGGVNSIQGINILDQGSASGSPFMVFRKSDEASIGTITRNGTSNAVLYNTTSDYRLKEEITPMSGALERVAKLKPVTWKWKDSVETGEGFIAHEVQEVVPSAVSGEKDAVDEKGKPAYQGMDASYLVATLTAAIQEQQAIITDLKARIETLESK